MPRCTVPGCKRQHQANGLCNAHNMRRVHGWDLESPVRTIRRLRPVEAKAIRRRYIAPAAPTIIELAESYQVSRVTIWRVLRGRAHRIDDGLQARIDEQSWANEHPLGRRSA